MDVEICNKLTPDRKWFFAIHTLLIMADPNFQTNKENINFWRGQILTKNNLFHYAQVNLITTPGYLVLIIIKIWRTNNEE
jgi:hypothetical protein